MRGDMLGTNSKNPVPKWINFKKPLIKEYTFAYPRHVGRFMCHARWTNIRTFAQPFASPRSINRLCLRLAVCLAPIYQSKPKPSPIPDLLTNSPAVIHFVFVVCRICVCGGMCGDLGIPGSPQIALCGAVGGTKPTHIAQTQEIQYESSGDRFELYRWSAIRVGFSSAEWRFSLYRPTRSRM